jgi:hypothetical protein
MDLRMYVIFLPWISIDTGASQRSIKMFRDVRVGLRERPGVRTASRVRTGSVSNRDFDMDSPNDEYESWGLVDRLITTALRRIHSLCDVGWCWCWKLKSKSEQEDFEDPTLEI